jgi:hypothetical protein
MKGRHDRKLAPSPERDPSLPVDHRPDPGFDRCGSHLGSRCGTGGHEAPAGCRVGLGQLQARRPVERIPFIDANTVRFDVTSSQDEEVEDEKEVEEEQQEQEEQRARRPPCPLVTSRA